MLPTCCCEDVAPGRTFPCSDAQIKLQYDLKMIKKLINKTKHRETFLLKSSHPRASLLSQLNNPSLVEGLVLINVDPCAEGWIDWAASKVSISASSMTRIFIIYEKRKCCLLKTSQY